MTDLKRGIGLTADAVIIEGGKVLLVRRGTKPFEGMWALPGGFIEYGETAEEAVKREVMEETGLEVEIAGLVGVYSRPDRDPRGHTITVAYRCRAGGGQARAGDDARDARWWPLDDLPELAFDHRGIIEDAR